MTNFHHLVFSQKIDNTLIDLLADHISITHDNILTECSTNNCYNCKFEHCIDCISARKCWLKKSYKKNHFKEYL